MHLILITEWYYCRKLMLMRYNATNFPLIYMLKAENFPSHFNDLQYIS